MHNIVVVNSRNDNGLPDKFKSDFEINHVRSVKAAVVYQIEFPEIDAIIYQADSLDHREILSNLDKSILLNPMVLQFIVGDIVLTTKHENNKNICVTDNLNDIHNKIINHSINRRQDNRASWPIQVKYHKANELSDGKWGMILSISVGGCFIRTDHLELGKVGDTFIMNIHFDDFNFLVEGEIIRIQRIANMSSPQGFSIKFHSPSPQTKSFIEEIINNKILATIFSDFTHLEGSDINAGS